MRIVKKIVLVTLAALFVAAVGCMIYYLPATASASLNPSALHPVKNNVSVYDGAGGLIAECSASGENGTEYDALPAYTVDAFLAAEDKRFFSHKGLDYRRMAKALWRNVTTLSFKEGASTISQQLVKNTQLSPEKTIDRKLKEIKLTRQLEKRYSKEEILEMYLNTIYFGHNCYGLESAARFYFGCAPEEMTVAQSATLAGMVKSPNNYSPFKNPENCLARRNFILNVMEKEGYIDAEERREAAAEELPAEGHSRRGFAESYLSGVFSEAEEYIGENAYGGLKIYTYLDGGLQKKLEELSSMSETDKSFCVIGNAERGVKAFYSTIGSAPRLPASAIKPLLVYAPALEENLIAPATPVLDEKTDFSGYAPRNFDGEYHGYVSAREALAKSYNVPAVKILNALGVKKAAAYLEKMGLPVEKDDRSLALALGGMKKGYPLQDIAAAYTTFANGGLYAPAAFVRKITDANGNTIYERATSERRVFGEDSVTLLNDMLSDAVQDGTARKLKSVSAGYELCAKTGTGGTDTGNTDAYCISYTAGDTVGVWLGNADNTSMEKITGGGLPANINAKILEKLYAEAPPPALQRSPEVCEYTLDKTEYEKNHRLVLCDPNAPVQEKTVHDLFKKSSRPREQSTFFSRPALSNIGISTASDGICIELCQTDYYAIIINREDEYGFRTVYQGKCLDRFTDTDVQPGKTYTYSVTPYYNEFVGKTILLPKVRFAGSTKTENATENEIKSDMINILCLTEYQENEDKGGYIPREWWRMPKQCSTTARAARTNVPALSDTYILESGRNEKKDIHRQAIFIDWLRIFFPFRRKPFPLRLSP